MIRFGSPKRHIFGFRYSKCRVSGFRHSECHIAGLRRSRSPDSGSCRAETFCFLFRERRLLYPNPRSIGCLIIYRFLFRKTDAFPITASGKIFIRDLLYFIIIRFPAEDRPLSLRLLINRLFLHHILYPDLMHIDLLLHRLFFGCQCGIKHHAAALFIHAQDFFVLFFLLQKAFFPLPCLLQALFSSGFFRLFFPPSPLSFFLFRPPFPLFFFLFFLSP